VPEINIERLMIARRDLMKVSLLGTGTTNLAGG
jgi:hypothetical protein